MEKSSFSLTAFKNIEKQVYSLKIPWVTVEAEKRDPFRVLVSCILSLRTKDEVTENASKRIFKAADNPEKLKGLPVKQIEKLIYPVGFYRKKAKNLKEISKTLVDSFHSKVPDSIDALLSLSGVGRKTANLVLGLGFLKPAICVDTHVHRISNRLGWVKTKTPEETEIALQKVLPKRLWVPINTIMVAFGQNICVPISPWCSKCKVINYCKKINVKKTR